MPGSTKDFSRKAGIIVAMVTATILVVLLFVSSVKVFLLVFAGIMVAVFFRGISSWLSGLSGITERITLPVSLIGVLGLWVLLVFLLAPRVGRETERMNEKLPEAVQELEQNLRKSELGRLVLRQIPFDLSDSAPGGDKQASTSTRTATPPDDSPDLKNNSGTTTPPHAKGESGLNNLRSRVMTFFSTTLGILGNLYVILFFGIFFMANPHPYKRGLVRLVPQRKRERAAVIYDATGITLRSWLLGKTLSMLVVAVLTVLGLWILGIPLFITLALFAGIMSFIPNFGPLIAIVPAFLVAYLQSPQQALVVVLLYMGIQALESNIITPVIMKKQIEVPLAMTLFSQLLLGYLVGGWGLIFATPIMAAVMVLIEMIYVEDVLGDKELDIKGERLAHKKRKDDS